MTPYAGIIHAVRSEVWAIQPQKLEAILSFLQLKAEGKNGDVDLVAAIKAEAADTRLRAQNVAAVGSGSVAVLPLYGLILYRGSSMGDISGPTATSVQKFTQQFRQAVNDPNIKAIIIDVDSPGGTVEGVEELAAEIRASRGKKRTIAVSNCLMASAAYYIASACTEIVVSPSSQTGSVGVYAAHEDDSEFLAKMGVKVSLIQFGENKTLGNPYEPLSDAGRNNMQASVDRYGEMFESAVAKGRKVSVAKVHDTFGQGKIFGAQDAVKLGMADTIGTLDDVLGRYGVSMGTAPQRSMHAADIGATSGVAVAASASAPTHADAEDGDGDCDCPCDPCVAGDCANCDCKGCDAENCGKADCPCAGAPDASEKSKAEAAARRRQIEIAIA